MQYICRKCGWKCNIREYHYRCPRCGGALDIEYETKNISKEILEKDLIGILKYREILPPLPRYFTLGEGSTPFKYIDEKKTYFLMEYLNPSGSFKDRGTAFTISYIYSYFNKSTPLIEDSSGNAGISFSLYGKAAGYNVHVFVPKNTPKGKIKYMKLLGSHIHTSKTRDETHLEALKYSKRGIYIGHLYNPFFLYGIETLVYDIYRILKQIDHIFIPFGSGTLYLGIYRGLRKLYEEGLLEDYPKIHIVEAKGYEKIANRSEEKARYLDGIKVSIIPRMEEIRKSLENIRWNIDVINDYEAISSMKEIIRSGFIVEPTSAAGYAAWRREIDRGGIKRGERSLIILTGSGLKMIREILNMFRELDLNKRI